ncbi:MAG: HPr family phosphocarrier protein [Parvularculaceae bacterium]|nr:HPr family phosphocarrier protein [Parvularculaceae bacterium]
MAAAENEISAELLIVNRRGLHARASAKFAAVAGAFDASVRVTKDGITVGACSIMGLMMLGAGLGSTITISATGAQAREAVETLAGLIADKFGEGA